MCPRAKRFVVTVAYWFIFRKRPNMAEKLLTMMLSKNSNKPSYNLYIQVKNTKANISSKGKQYLLFKDNLNF